ncbi:MAG: hypothetical protein H3Z53_02325 [archaeon]|nr:hypothetical protein [archaeon]MCP8313195.1 hypothetical protein [archaeon]MCP8316071.1 hypothetical protein [archaeon]MCP8320229.1 hypothetical protein [archaeon]
MKEVKIGDTIYKIKPATPWNVHLLQRATEQRTEESYRELFKAMVDPQPSDEDSLAVFMEISNYVDEITKKARFFRKEQDRKSDRRVEFSPT